MEAAMHAAIEGPVRRSPSVWGFDHTWQTPASTEEYAFRRCWAEKPQVQDAVYVGFPWATLIDHLQTGSGKGTALADGLGALAAQLCGAHPWRRVVTVCQHIFALKYLELFKQLGVTDLFWPHAEHNTRQLDGITIHPFPLYPAMTATLHEQEACQGKRGI